MDLKSVLSNIAKPETLENISKATGENEKSVQDVIEAGLPLILGKMEKNVDSEEGAASLEKALNDHNDGSVLDNLAGIFGGDSSNNDGLAILGHVFGNKDQAAASNVSEKTGVDMATVMRILSFIAPLVLAYLAQKRGSGTAKDTVKDTKDEAGNPLIDIATAVLDKNKDGSVVDDLVGGLFGKK